MRHVVVLLVLAALPRVAQAQGNSILDGRTPKGVEAGSPAGSYALSGLDTVNLYNGNLNISVPLYQIGAGARGEADYTIQSNVTKGPWYVYTYTQDLNTGAIPCPPTSSSCLTSYSYAAMPPGSNLASLDIRYKPAVIFARSSTNFWLSDCPPPTGVIGLTVYTLTRLTVLMGDGTEIELSDQTNLARPWPWGNVQSDSCTTPQPPQYDRGKTFVSTDASDLIFISTNDIFDSLTTAGGFGGVSGTLYSRDGRQIRFQNGYPLWIQDRNGNQTTFDYSPTCAAHGVQPPCNVVDEPSTDTSAYPVEEFNVTDAANRVTKISLDNDDSQVNGTGATKDTITTPVGSVIVVYSQPYWHDCPSCNGAVPLYSTLFPLPAPGSPLQYSGIYQIQIPSGNTYKFQYNPYAEIIQMTLPTGGAIQYDWPSGLPDNADQIQGPTLQQGFPMIAILRKVQARREYANTAPTAIDSSNYTRSTQYGYAQLSGVTGIGDPFDTISDSEAYVYRCAATTVANGSVSYINYCTKASVTESDSSGVLSYQDHYFYGSPTNLNTLFPSDFQGLFAPWMEGREFRTVTAANIGSISSPLRDEHQVLGQRAYPSWFTAGGLIQPPAGDPRLAYADEVIDNGKVSARALSYSQDAFNNVTKIVQYDYGQGAPGAVLKQTQASFSSNFTNPPTTVYLPGLPTFQSVLDGSGNTVSQTQYPSYDSNGNAKTVERWRDTPTPATWLDTTATFDAYGNPLSVTDPRNNMTTFSYACSNAFLGSVTNAAQQTTTYTYTDCNLGKPSSITGIDNTTTSLVYTDPLQRLTEATLADGSKTDFAYSSDMTTVTTTKDLDSSRRITSSVATDLLGQTVSATDTATVVTSTYLDGLGRVAKSCNPGDTSNCTTSTFDALGRPLHITYADNSLEQLTYAGDVTTHTDAAGASRQVTADALGRITQLVEDPGTGQHLNYVTTYTYDALDDLVTVTQGPQAAQQSRSFTYDSLKELTGATNPESGATTYNYDDNGNLYQKIAGGVTVTYCAAGQANVDQCYDPLNRVLNKTYSDSTPAVTYAYDQVRPGCLNSVSNSSSTTSYSAIGAFCRVVTSTQTTGGTPYTFSSYLYNLNGGLTQETYPSQRVISYGYDSAGRTNQIVQGALSSPVKTYAGNIRYAPHGALNSMVLGNGVVENWTFNNRLQPTNLKVCAATPLVLGYNYNAGSNNGNVSSAAISWPAAPCSGTPVSPQYNQAFVYDSVNRLTQAAENSAPCSGSPTGGWCQQFGYTGDGAGAFGNRSGQSFGQGTSPLMPQTFSPSNNHIADSGWSYDSRGNVIADPGPSTYAYDAENRQIYYCSGTTSSCSASNATKTYSYDGDGRRVQTQGSSGTTTFVYDATGQLAAEYGSTSSAPCSTCYVTVDGLGSTRMVTDGNGACVSREDYMPFGQLILRSSVSCYPGTTIRHQFTSKERDSESGLDFFGARYMSSAQGRFTSPDAPFADQHPADPQSWNLYAYVRNNPLKNIDPNGTDCQSGAGACANYFLGGLGAVANAVTSGIINGPNRVIDAAISPFTSFRFGDVVPNLFTPSNVDQRQGMEAANAIMLIAPGLDALAGTTAVAASAEAMTNAAQAVKAGSFSITDWTGYPAGVPKPPGGSSFRLVEGAEYDAARKAASQANQAIRQADPAAYTGKEIHEITPVKFGGAPTDPANKVALPTQVHRQQVTPWWNKLKRDLGNLVGSGSN